ncbi:hypothetical protein L915_21758 [Phytophthora nicotianae]|uniref:BED-type domain-containing protein n=1 Tax=Phytophthora nicotianae TaxID=4792 RepID=W2FJG1_PHYNI|nr:hypothetical protein L915_21758 [Phytophthora nicotianae]
MPTSAEICAFFFDEGTDYRFTRKICNGARKRAPATGYSNLVSHLGTKHPDFLTEMATSRRAENGTIESFGFVSKAVDHLYRWLRWVVARNLPPCEVDDPLTRAMSCRRPTGSKTMKENMHLAAAKIGKLLEEEMGDACAGALLS